MRTSCQIVGDPGGVPNRTARLAFLPLWTDPATPIVVIAEVDKEEICKTAMSHGARDYLLEGHVDSYAFARALRNIGEREAARQELFLEKERAQVTLNSIGDTVLSTNVSGNVSYMNVVAEQ